MTVDKKMLLIRNMIYGAMFLMKNMKNSILYTGI